MGARLYLVGEEAPITVEDLLAAAAQSGLDDALAVIGLASRLAGDTVALIQAQGDPSVLASIVCVIQDQRLKVAYLEAIASRLI